MAVAKETAETECAQSAPHETATAAVSTGVTPDDGKHHILIKVNVPFCYHHCEFCTRNVIPGWNSARMAAYADALINEIESNEGEFDDCIVDAVHLGGGVVSMAGGEAINAIAGTIRKCFNVPSDAPFTMRSSMASISGATMPLFRRAGITRYDFEVMALSSRQFLDLDFVDTTDKMSIVTNSFLHANRNHNLGLVLLYGKASFRILDFRRTLIALVRGAASHVIMQRYEGNDPASDEQVAEQVAQIHQVLPEYGFIEYAPMRFALPGSEDRYTLEQMSGIETLGFGVGAKTHFAGIATVNTMDFERYRAHSDDCTMISKIVADEDTAV